MRILYIAKHGQGRSNDDEGAITHCLREMGHQVTLLPEINGRIAYRTRTDVVLFHKWKDHQALAKLEGRVVRAFWYFDLVNFPDPSLARRCEDRRQWMREITPNVDVGFCTDGDWVNQDRSGKLVRLTQGADERVMGYVDPPLDAPEIPILFTGTQRGGKGRHTFVAAMRAKFGDAFHHVESGAHGKELASLIGRAKVVVAPDSPVTDNYWSNRVYLTLGFGGFLLHPYARGLDYQYKDGTDLVMYQSRMELFNHIEYYLRPENEKKRREIATNGLKTTKLCNTYRHRCEVMCAILEEKVRILPVL